MKIWMYLMSDTIFGSGMSIPGGEDISIRRDEQGFPYYKGSSLKGIFREELGYVLLAQGAEEADVDRMTSMLLGESGDDGDAGRKLVFTDLEIPAAVKAEILREIGDVPEEVFDTLSHTRTFTALDEDGVVQDGSLRIARCVNQGIWFTGEIRCPKEHEELLKEVLGWIKWVGTMRNRGFGKVRFAWEED